MYHSEKSRGILSEKSADYPAPIGAHRPPFDERVIVRVSAGPQRWTSGLLEGNRAALEGCLPVVTSPSRADLDKIGEL